MIRIAIVAILLILFLIISIPVQLIYLIIGIFSPRKKDELCLNTVQTALKAVLKLAGTKTTIKGLENVPSDEPVLYILNHRSIFDVVITYTMVPRPTGYIAKKEMAKYFTLSTWMMFLHCEFLDRNNNRQGLKVIKKAAANIKRGISIAIFPEGTRNKTEEPMLEFHKGSFALATMTNCKIIPVVLNNTSSILEDHFPVLKPVHAVIEYLPAIDTAALSRTEKKQLPDTVRELMIETYIKNSALI